MSLGRARSIALVGLTGVPIDIEVDVVSGLPAIRLVGLADRAVNEAIDRVRSAVTNSEFAFPAQRVTISLSPAALPKSGSTFDLPIAMACLASLGLASAEAMVNTVFIGELALDGRLRPTAGILPAVLAARTLGIGRVVVPRANLAEAQLVSGITVVGVSSLREAVEPGHVDAQAILHADEVDVVVDSVARNFDLSDVIGVETAVEALVVAAVGGHNLFMVGPPGAGKTMLASRLSGILPPLTEEEALEVAAIQSLVEGARRRVDLDRAPPFQAPHHTLSAAGMVGGGAGVARPGVAVRAHRGVLFLDEAPEFATNVLDCLRQPLESGRISLHRAAFTVEFPSAFQLVLAANPCPCGQSASGNDVRCECTGVQRRRYLARLSGPLMDRVDLHVTVPRTTVALRSELTSTITSANARARVTAARAAAVERWGIGGNARVPGTVLRGKRYRLAARETAPIDIALRRGDITMRGYDRVLRVAWSLADLDGVTTPNASHIGRALYFRKGINQ